MMQNRFDLFGFNRLISLIKGDVQLLMVSDVPDTAYEICTKYAPDCNQGTFSSNVDVSNKSRSRKKSSNKTKSSSKKSRKTANNLEIASNLQKRQNMRSTAEHFDEFDNLEIDSNGEDEAYYDSLASGNDEGIFGRSQSPNLESVTLNPFVEIEEKNFDEETLIRHEVNHNVPVRNRTIVTTTTVDYDQKSEARWVKGEKGERGEKGRQFLSFNLNLAKIYQLIRRRWKRRFRRRNRPSGSSWSCFYVISIIFFVFNQFLSLTNNLEYQRDKEMVKKVLMFKLKLFVKC